MSEDIIEGIDKLLAEELPDNPQENSHEIDDERRQEMIQLLRYAEDELGRSPSLREFNSLNLEISGYEIENTFGSWNNAKREADLELYGRGEGRKPSTSINETYFETIDTHEKAYWLGTLIGTSALRLESSQQLSLVRVRSKEYFVKEFSRVVESEYAISVLTVTRQSGQDTERIQTRISNTEFIENLISAGYPKPDESEYDFPTLMSDYRAPFVRGYLESSGYFSSGWQITVGNKNRAETLQKWFADFGAKRPTIGKSNGNFVVRTSNIFDIKAIFETCWPNNINTEPSFTPYPKKVIQYLQSKYPYPENVDYLHE